MTSSANRMKELLKGLLDYAMLGKESQVENVNLNDTVNAVLNDLKAKISGADATFRVENLPSINGHKNELSRLFQNLVSNAVKFRRENVPLVVKISAQREDNQWLFSLEDNGIGVNQTERERIFLMFKRLHHRNKIPGNGIGLSESKKIVEMHHGKIWFEAAHDAGSIVKFTLNP